MPEPGKKSYLMIREAEDACAYIDDGVQVRELPHIVHHSPDGYEWGYGGSGPADLARSILTDAVGPTLADRHYQDFKWRYLAGLPDTGGTISADAVVDFVMSEELRLPESKRYRG